MPQLLFWPFAILLYAAAIYVVIDAIPLFVNEILLAEPFKVLAVIAVVYLCARAGRAWARPKVDLIARLTFWSFAIVVMKAGAVALQRVELVGWAAYSIRSASLPALATTSLCVAAGVGALVFVLAHLLLKASPPPQAPLETRIRSLNRNGAPLSLPGNRRRGF